MFHNTARKVLMLATLSLPIAALGFHSVEASQRGFVLRNATSSTIVDVRVSRSDRSQWGSNILNGVLLRGKQTLIGFNPANNVCLYDLRVVTADQRKLDRRQINFCKVSAYTLTN